MIITLSGRRVKSKSFQRPRKIKGSGKLLGAKQSGWLRVHRVYLGDFDGVQKTEECLYVTPRLLRIERPAKAPAPWAGVTYSPTETGKAAMEEAEAFAAYQLNLYSEGMNTVAWIAEVQRCYEAKVRQDFGGLYVDFEGTLTGDWVCVSATDDPACPFRSAGRGWAVQLPAEAFERAAQLLVGMEDGARMENGGCDVDRN